MSDKDPVIQPLRPIEAKALIRRILHQGVLTYVEPHAKDRMKERNISCVDCVNVLRGGKVEEAESEKGSWRYRVRTPTFVVVVEFLSRNDLLVVTAWRVES